jgi:hypothetical protein
MSSLGEAGRFLGRHAALVAFPLAWAACVALAQLRVLLIQQPWSLTMWLVVVAVPVAYVVGAAFGRDAVAGFVRGGRRAPPSREERRRLLRILLAGCAVLGNLEEAHQFAAARTIPLFSSHIDEARFALPGGPTIILTDLLMVAAIMALVIPGRLFARDALPELGIAAFAVSGYLLAAGRGTIIQALTVAAIGRWMRFGPPKPRAVLIGVALGLVFVVAVFYLRTLQHRNDALGTELRERVYPTLPTVVHPLVPVDLALTTNFEALSRIVSYFPAGMPYGHGAYVAHGFDLFIHSARDIQQVSAELSPPWVTSTVAGPLWADGGLPFVVVSLMIIGAVVGASYEAARRTRRLRLILVAANFLFLALFGIYVNLWTQQVDWILVTPLLYAFASIWEGQAIIPAKLRTFMRRVRPRMALR